MPVMFNTGEREPRPLYPDELVYTTVQKVADILQIPYLDPVDLANDSSSTYVEVSPSDQRLMGFEVGDSIEIVSDATTGETRKITTISLVNGKTRLSFSSALAETHTTANNATVQNLQSFTNGKTRGVAKSHVETMILRMQDKIDNLCNNSWRPMLQTAEYVNFDTYKPYRRRYYTDYVGTTPLRFRNIQQVLRLEVWQGQDYREVASAEGRLEILDHSKLTTNDYVHLCPGGGGVASLRVGAAADQWRADFDNSITAQQLADLINKDIRRNKSAVTFSPSFSLESTYATDGTGLITANVHHEFMASSNADYGAAKLKLTSLHRGEGGENSTLAVSNLDAMAVTGLTDNKATISSLSGGVLTVDSTANFANYGLLQLGTGTSVKVAYYTGKTATTLTGVTEVGVSGFNTGATNGVEVTQYKLAIDYVGDSTGDEARLRDWWCDYELGIIYFNNTYPYFMWNAVKVTYVYGERYVEKAIEDICTKMVAMDLLLSDDRTVLLPEGTSNIDLGSKYQLFKAQVAETLPRYIEVMTLD